ncbi:phage tail assembly protein [Chelatococcus sp. XZ-Ab1]|uniref:phage tail assembly protein n=1 Tax=Chelatococcus sp. XZ-Ab1 TaxID=3034027 RepID=UPI0023E39E7C|nr:phage tail assembly protein [Chelatococcus sp. XZ-Ab1]
MAKYDLKYPIEVDGKTISTVTIRRPKGKDMVVIGDHVAALARFYTSNAKAMKGSLEKAVAAGLKAAEDGASAPPVDDLDEIDAAELTPPDAAVYRAMVAIADRIADLGEAAGELDLVDLQEIATRSLNPGEA